MDATIVLLNDSGRWLVTQLGHMSVELAILAGFVLVALYVLRVKSPALRHLFWGLLLAKPVVTFLVASPLSLYGFFWPTIPEVFYTSAPEKGGLYQASEITNETGLSPFLQKPDTKPVPLTPQVTPAFWRQIDRYGLISALWALVASLFGLRLLLGCAYVSFLRSTAQTQREGPLADLVAEAGRPLRMRRRVRIATTRVAHGPVLAGILRPIILLPENIAEELTPGQLKLVITHELAHARRWDNLVLLVQRLAEMFFFFHPVVWFCGWMMRREAEAACDDMVVSAYGDVEGVGAAAYADSLTRVAEMKCGITRRLLVNTFAAAESNFTRRIHRILSGRRTKMTLWLSLATGAALVLIGALGLPTVRSAQNGSEGGKSVLAENGQAQLQGGVSVEIEGIGLNSVPEKLWWDSDGKALPQAPFAGFPSESPGTYEIVVSLTGRDDLRDRGATPEIWHFSGKHASGGQCGHAEDASGQNRCLRAATFRPEGERQTETDVRLGIVLGPWETKGITRTGGDTISESLKNGHFTMTAPAVKDGKITVETTFSRKLDDVATHRVVAILKDGTELNGSENIHGGLAFLQARADNIITCASIEDIDHVEFQICDYQWAEFQHVPLSPLNSLTSGEQLPLERLLEQPGSIAFENQHVSEILEFISDSTDTINFAIDWRVVQLPPNQSSKANRLVCGRKPVYVTDGMVPFIDVRNLPWYQVLDSLVQPLGLAYDVRGHYVWISSLEMIQEDAADSVPPPRNPDSDLMKTLSGISNIEFEDISVREILNFISDSHNIRIVVDNAAVAPMEGASQADAAAYVTNGFVPYINLRGVPISEIFEAVLRPLDLAAVVDGDTVHVIACRARGTVPEQAPPDGMQQETSEPPLAVEYLLRTPGSDGIVYARVQAGTKKMWVKPGDARGGYLVKDITLDPGLVTVSRQADGKEWAIPVDSAAIRDAVATDPVENETLKLLDIKTGFGGVRARIQTREGSRGYWFNKGVSFEKYLIYDINAQEGTALVTDDDGKSFLLKLESEQAVPDPAPKSETEAKRFSVPLKEGRSVELLAVRKHGPNDQSFWRPDGTPLAESPYDHVEPTVAADGTLFEFVFRNKGIDLNQPMEFEYDGASGVGSTVPLARDESVVPGLMVHTVFLKDNPEAVNVYMKFASDNWTSVLLNNDVRNSSSVYSMDNYSVTFAELYEKDNTVRVTLTFTGTMTESALRLVAMDKSGQSHTGNLYTGTGVPEKMRQNTYSFSDVKLEDIQSFQVETCAWEEVEFTNVSLAAGRHTDCKVSAKVTVKIPDEQIRKVNINSENNTETPLNIPVSGSFRVAPLVRCLDEKIKDEWKSQGITGDPAIVKKLQEVTLEMMRKELDRVSLQDVALRKGAHGRIIVEPPEGMDTSRVMFPPPGMVRFCPAASAEETLKVLRNAEKEPRFQGRIDPLIDHNPNKNSISIKQDQREAALKLLSELQSVLPENHFFLCGSRLDPNALYLLDFNTSIPNVKVRSAEAVPDNNDPGHAMILVMLTDEDAKRFGELTQSLIGKSLAVLVDSEIQMVPTVRDKITKSFQITGNYTPEEAAELAARLSSPGYPAPLAWLPGLNETSEALEERTYENINEDAFERIKTHLLPVYDPNTGEELSTVSYDKASGRLTVHNLPDNLACLERLMSHLGLPKKIKISSSPSSQLASCANNLKQYGLIAKLYANEAPQQMLPPLSPWPGCLIWHKEAVYPEYLTDPTILICPTEEEKLQQANGMEEAEDKASFCFGNSSYWYLGYALPDEKTGLAFAQAYRKQVENSGDFTADLKDAEGNPIPIRRLQEGVERYFITDIHDPAGAAMIQSKLPVFIERPGHHDTQINVLFMDGHVERLAYPGEFPVSQRFIEALGTLDTLRNTFETGNAELPPPSVEPVPTTAPQPAADAPDNTMALAEFRLYIAHGAVTQKGNPLPDTWDGKSFRPIVRGLLTSAMEADAYAVGGTPLVMDGNTLTWAGKETPDPGCASLAASYSFMMRREERIRQTISIPPEAGLPASIPNEAEMKVTCHLIKEGQIRLWLTMPQPTEASPEDMNAWVNVAAAAPNDTWQLMVLDVLNEKNEPQVPLLLCWKFRYGMEQDLKRITPPARVGNVAISQSPAPDMTRVPEYTTEAKILSGPAESIEQFVNTLETFRDVRVSPEKIRAFRVADINKIQVLLSVLDKQTPGLELLSAPRICMRSAEDMAKVEANKEPETLNFPSAPNQIRTVIIKGYVPKESWQKSMGPYSASLVDFLQGQQYPGVIADFTIDYAIEPESPGPVPSYTGIAVAVALHKTDDPRVMDLRLYFNSKEREPRGFFESPVTLAIPFPLDQCIGFMTGNRDPEKKTLVLLTLEQVNAGDLIYSGKA